MSKIKLSANTAQFPTFLNELVSFSWNLPKIKLPALNFKDSSSMILGMIVVGYTVLMIIGAYGIYANQSNAQSIYQNRLMVIKNFDDASELIQKTDAAIKNAIYDSSKGKTKSFGTIDGLIASNTLRLNEVLYANSFSAKGPQEKELFDAYTSLYSEWISKNLKGAQAAIIGNNIGQASQIYSNAGDMVAILDQNARALVKIQYEASRKDAAQGRGYFYFFIVFGSLISILLVLVIIHLLNNSKRIIDTHLGAEPEKLLEAAGHVASGDLNYQIRTRDGDHSSVLAAIKAIQEEFRLFLLDSEALNKALFQGKTLGRRNIEQHQGEFQNLARELNSSIDYSLSYSQDSEKKYKEITSYLTSTNLEIQELLKAIKNKNLSERLAISSDSESEFPAASTINYILDLVEDVLTKIRNQASTTNHASDEIKAFQEKINLAYDEQKSLIDGSKNSLDKITSLNKSGLRSLKSIQNRAIEASKSINAICQKIDELQYKRVETSTRSSKDVTVVYPLDNISFTSLDSGNTSIIKNDVKKSLTQNDIENINEMTGNLKKIIETLDGIAKDGSKMILSNAEQNTNLLASHSDLTKIQNAIQNISQFRTPLISNEMLDLKTVASEYILKSDIEKLEKERKAAEAKLAEEKKTQPVKDDSDWELF